MTTEEKQRELIRHRDLLFAAEEYIFRREFGSMVYDSLDQMKEFQKLRIQQIEKYFQEQNLDELKRDLHNAVEGLRRHADLQFAQYIKERTGEELDLFSEIEPIVERVLTQGKIQTDEEETAVDIQWDILKQTGADPDREALLLKLIVDYCERKEDAEEKFTYTKNIRREEQGSIKNITVHIHSDYDYRPAVDEEYQSISPGGKYKLYIRQISNNDTQGYTYVEIGFPGIRGIVLAARGLYFDVKAHWEDGNTIIVEIPEGIDIIEKHNILQSFEDVVAVEFVDRQSPIN